MRALSHSRLLLAALLAVALLTSGCSELPFGLRFSGVIEPAIVPSKSDTGMETVERSFAFEDGTVKLSMPMDRAVYAGSVTARKSAVFIGTKRPPDWAADYYRAFVDEKHQDEFYTSLLRALHAVRKEEGLDSDRYVELVVSMAQRMEYRTDPGDLAPKFPIETFGDDYGDCDDKTLLAAALLARDGYDVSVLMFTPEKHVSLGIKAPGLDYKDTGYAYVEMTAPSLVGVPAESLTGNVDLTSQPVVIRIGNGTHAYTAGAQVSYIQRRLREVRAAGERMHERVQRDTEALKSREAELAAERDQLSGRRDPASARAAIDSYNERVAAYNADAEQLRELVARYNALVEAERYVIDHQSSRRQVYERLRAVRL